MFKTIRDMFVGALIPTLITAALALTGTAPGTGPQLIDGIWAQGVANGLNASFLNGVTCTGSTQATAFQLPSAATLIELDTVAASTGCNLPTALPGVEISIYNNGANTATIYPTVPNNPVTGVQDTLNNATTTTVASHTSIYVFCAKAGIWSVK
jgi:hypothetical protein